MSLRCAGLEMRFAGVEWSILGPRVRPSSGPQRGPDVVGRGAHANPTPETGRAFTGLPGRVVIDQVRVTGRWCWWGVGVPVKITDCLSIRPRRRWSGGDSSV